MSSSHRNFGYGQTSVHSNVPPSSYNPTFSQVFSTPQRTNVSQTSVQSSVQTPVPIVSHVITTPLGNIDHSSMMKYKMEPTTLYPSSPLIPPAQWKSPPTTWSTSHNNPGVTFPSSNGNTNIHAGIMNPPTFSQTSWTHWSPGMNFSSNTTSEVRLKKIPLPTFSGMRKDWPEFKEVWKQLAKNTYTNKTALAHELKRSVKEEASARI